jgi:hypothetical protein
MRGFVLQSGEIGAPVERRFHHLDQFKSCRATIGRGLSHTGRFREGFSLRNRDRYEREDMDQRQDFQRHFDCDQVF